MSGAVTHRAKRGKRYGTLDELKTATLAKCRADLEKRCPGTPWTEERCKANRAALDEDLTDITSATAALVSAFASAADAVARRPGDPRVAGLHEFLATLSDKSKAWLGHFSDRIKVGWNVAPKDGRTRLALYELHAQNHPDPWRLARLSLLLGYFPHALNVSMTVGELVDLERKAFVQAIKRALKFQDEQTTAPSVFAPGTRVRIREACVPQKRARGKGHKS